MQESKSQIEKNLREEYYVLQGELSEKGRRKWAGFQAQRLGHGGKTLVHPATALDYKTIISSDTAEFAVNSIRSWWTEIGQETYQNATRLYINADGGGSNGSRNRLWKKELQQFANETNLEIHVSHFPPGTSKWNKIEHRLFSFISANWRGKPLIDRATVVSLIANTTTKTGLKIRAKLDERSYQTGIKVSDQEMKLLNLHQDTFHGEWNYFIQPH